jgi:cysteine desulfurase
MDAIWLDGNQTGPFAKRPLAAFTAWAQKSAALGVAEGRTRDDDLLRRAKAVIAAGCGFALKGPSEYEVIFTSGAEESTSHLILSAVSSFVTRTRIVGSVVIGGASDMDPAAVAAVAQLVEDSRAEVVELPVRACGDPKGGGTFEPSVVKAAVRQNTCLVSIQAAHVTTGAISNIRQIKKAVGPSIPLHVDMSLIFGRVAVSIGDIGIDAVTADFHRIGGPPGVGVLILKRSFIDGYGLRPHIFGRGQAGLRGGTLPPGVLAGALESFRVLASADRRKEWGRKVLTRREELRRLLVTKFPVTQLAHYKPTTKVQLVFLSPAAPLDVIHVLPSTLLFSLGHAWSINRKVVAGALGKIGMRCHIPSDDVMSTLGLDPTLFAGAMGVCAGPKTTREELVAFVDALASAIGRGVGLGDPPKKRERREASFARPT